MKWEQLKLTLPQALPRARSHPGNFPDWRGYSSSSRPTPPVSCQDRIHSGSSSWPAGALMVTHRSTGCWGSMWGGHRSCQRALGSHCQHLPTVNLKAGSNHTTCVEDETRLNVLTCNQWFVEQNHDILLSLQWKYISSFWKKGQP